jgi:hypothetical protein
MSDLPHWALVINVAEQLKTQVASATVSLSVAEGQLYLSKF